MLVVGRKVFEHLGQTGQYPAIAACPEVFLAVCALVLGIHILGIAVVQAFFVIEHDAVAHQYIVIEFVEIFGILGDFIHFVITGITMYRPSAHHQ